MMKHKPGYEKTYGIQTSIIRTSHPGLDATQDDETSPG